jgi:uncharacterized C2H2 Zn-finger protein
MMTEGDKMREKIEVQISNETFERGPLPKVIKGQPIRTRPVVNAQGKVTLQCNECGKKRKVSPDGEYFDRCPKCGGVDWDVL